MSGATAPGMADYSCNSVNCGLQFHMLTIRETIEFSDWLMSLRDGIARARIARRISRLAAGNPGDFKPVGQGISELRIDHGPGYRVYFVQEGSVLILLLCGGDKSSQSRDITRAKKIANAIKE